MIEDEEEYIGHYEINRDVKPIVDEDGFKHWFVFERHRGKPVLNIPAAMSLPGNPEFIELTALERQRELTEFYRKKHQELVGVLSSKVNDCRRHTEILDEAFDLLGDIVKQYDASVVPVGADLGDSINVFARSFLKLYGSKNEKIQSEQPNKES